MSFFCSSCHLPAEFVCDRCNVERYCSIECQKMAFSQHRFVCFNLPALRRTNSFDCAPSAPQTPTKIVQSKSANAEMQNLQSAAAAVVIAEKPKEILKEKVIEAPKPQPLNKPAVKEVEKPKEIIIEAPKPQPLNKPAVKEIEKPAVKEMEKPKVDPPIKVPFNQGPRSTAPNEMKKKLSVPSIAKEPPTVAEEKTATTSADLNMIRRNHQQQASPLAGARPKLTFAKPQPKKIFYNDMKIRELTIGKHKVNVLNGDPDTKIFYILEQFDGVQEYCNWIEETVQEVVKMDDKTTSYEPETEEMVLAKFEGMYYRAICSGKNGDKFIVFFTDYGNMSEVSASDIKPFSPKLEMEVIIHEVFMANLPTPLNKKSKEILAKEEGFEIEVKNERTETGSYIADIVGL